jgi:hypothetical protein
MLILYSNVRVRALNPLSYARLSFTRSLMRAGECGYDGGLIVDDDPLLPTYQARLRLSILWSCCMIIFDRARCSR